MTYRIAFMSSLLLFCFASPADESVILTPGSALIDSSVLEPYEVTFRYHRPETTDPNVGTRVTWRLERIAPRESGNFDSKNGRDSFMSTLITHADAQDYFDINQFDATTLEHLATDIPTMTENRELADIHYRIKDQHVLGAITPRKENSAADEITDINVTLDRSVIGGGDLLFATLPLAPGKRFTWPTFDILNKELKWENAKIQGQETISTINGEITAWVVITRDGDGKLWVNKEPPYVYRREFKHDGVLFIVWELAQ